MKVRLADKIGFCFGVKRAVDMAGSALKKIDPIYSLGSIIHNREVVDGLSRRGLKVIRDMRQIRGGAVVISSHGISPKTAKRISMRGIKIIDTTCPFVLNAQKIARRLSDKGYTVVIVGDANHPEVKALVDFVPKKVFVVKDTAQARLLRFGPGERISIISQTTQSMGNFLDVVKAILEHKPKEAMVFSTICKDAAERQEEARRLARQVEAMLIIGGRDSANTHRLFEVCKKILKKSYLIETEKELKMAWFKGTKTVGVASGASTPDWMIERVVEKLKSIKKGVV